MIVYHGSTIEVNNPDMQHSYRNLDFGKGFYVTTVREQAERWAKRKADLSGDGNGVTIGKVANDKVYRVVDMYRRGIWDKQRALSEMKVYETYDQIAFVSQDAIDRCLSFKESFEV